MERGRTDLGPRWQMLTRIDLEVGFGKFVCGLKLQAFGLALYFGTTSDFIILQTIPFSAQSHGQVLFSEIPHMHWIPCEKDKVP